MKKIISIILLVIAIIIFTNNNDLLFKKEIIKIKSIERIKEEENRNDLGIIEKTYTEKITGIQTNGKERGKEKSVIYQYQESEIITEKYHIGDKVFIKNHEIEGLKRDQYLIYLIIILFISIYLIGKKKGVITILCGIGNIIIFYGYIVLYKNIGNIIPITIIISIIYTIVSLISSSGWNQKTKIAIVSTLISLLILLGILESIMITTKMQGINFNELAYLTVPPEELFIASLIIGTLGAIMDVAITISSSINEMIKTKEKITNNEILKSSKEIGSDIMPTMINVLFFTYFCSGLPILVLAIRNGFTLYNFLTTFYTLEITRFLCGSIGIAMTIPITTYIAMKMMRKETSYE